jgi:hypothetical protein
MILFKIPCSAPQAFLKNQKPMVFMALEFSLKCWPTWLAKLQASKNHRHHKDFHLGFGNSLRIFSVSGTFPIKK